MSYFESADAVLGILAAEQMAQNNRLIALEAKPVDPTRGLVVPYDARSPWNTVIPANVVVDPKSATYITAISDNNLPLTSDVDQYSIPVYLFDGNTPYVPITGSGFFSSYDAGDNSRVGHGQPWTVLAPIPPDAVGGFGTDGQIILWNPDSGIEYNFWQLNRNPSNGQFVATNGSRTHTTTGYFGRFADGLAGRGAGTTYFAGLTRGWEVRRGLIEHALAFAYKYPAKPPVYPASKSDGLGVAGVDPPEGSRLQLLPTKTEADFNSINLHPSARVIARALQQYGMYVVDNSGSSKIVMEANHTANWGPEFTRDLLSAIPWSWFRVVAPPTAVA